ncbi:XRE family transcriptional regulator [Kosakonia oryziphila]|uniref:Phage repressor protein C, contains Cro/C1-type HTH and peptisase s24 domains n=1 Tax=Kosakonia oryziphila TaxID=1005667 RepID=A0A1C4G2P0_9ENTR|nr:helix-turn-helix transcriptional regulator [Kosakonia oryziphila]SCC62145.1 Phage repressor protein C, contains Cro/C1-type HTH and peptisase s24 domains [Kosakonia oryziphila]
MSISERVKNRRIQIGLTQTELANLAGVSQQAIQQLEDGKILRPRYIVELAASLQCDVKWLQSGIGEQEKRERLKEDQIPPEHEWGKVDAWDKHPPLPTDEVEVPFLKDIEFACGDGSVVDEDYNGFKLRFSKATLRRVGANSDGSGVLCFPAAGDSMEPFIPDGATVAINTNDKKIVDGKVYAINQDGWKRLKLLYRTGPTTVSIRSFNTEGHPPEDAELQNLEIIGRMFWSSTIW